MNGNKTGRFALPALLLSSLLLAGTLAGCNGDTPTTPTTPTDQTPSGEQYEATVLHADQTGVRDVSVDLQLKTDKTKRYSSYGKTGEDGKVSVYVPTAAEYYVIPTNIPEGYTYNAGALVTAENRTATITLGEITGEGTWAIPYSVGQSFQKTVQRPQGGWADEIYFEWRAGASGIYTVKVEGDGATLQPYGMGGNKFGTPVTAPNAQEKEVATPYKDSPDRFGVTVSNAATEQFTVSVYFTDYLFEKSSQVVEITPTQTAKASYEKPAGDYELSTKGLLNGANEVYVDENGVYRVRTGTGSDPVLLVQMKHSVGLGDSSEDQPFTQLDIQGGNPYRYDVTSAEDRADNNKPLLYHDYRRFLRGFVQYDHVEGDKDQGHSEAPPIENRTGDFYEKYANAEGHIAVTEEFGVFLKLFAQKEAGNISYAVGESKEPWLFACSYYVEKEGSSLNPVPLDEYYYDGYVEDYPPIDLTGTRYYSLTVEAGDTFSVTASNEKFIFVYDDGTGEKDYAASELASLTLTADENGKILFALKLNEGDTVAQGDYFTLTLITE